MKVSTLFENEFSFDSVHAEIVKVRKAHLQRVKEALASIPGVTDVKLNEGNLDESFKQSSFTFKYQGHECRCDMSHTGFSMAVKLLNELTNQAKNTRTLKASMDRILKKHTTK